MVRLINHLILLIEVHFTHMIRNTLTTEHILTLREYICIAFFGSMTYPK